MNRSHGSGANGSGSAQEVRAATTAVRVTAREVADGLNAELYRITINI